MSHHRILDADEDRDSAVAESHEVSIVVGSGQRGRSYLVQQAGALFMSPLTWYPERGMWDLSPGYEQNDLGFSRPVLEDCLFCHSQRMPTLNGTKNSYSDPVTNAQSIGCQRCHGPAGAHIAHHTSPSGSDSSEDPIVNPGKLSRELREAVCQQCHLSGAARVVARGRSRYDFRPGEPLHDTIATYVLAKPPNDEDAEHFVGQVEQMYASRCFEGSDGQLGCISCHDPHRVPQQNERSTFYRRRCLRCHEEVDCGLVLEQRLKEQQIDDCVACHMPRMETDVRHASATDHRIPRNSDATSIVSSPEQSGEIPISLFPPGVRRDSAESARNRAIALLHAATYHAQRVTPFHLQDSMLPLERWISLHPDDVEAREALGDLLMRSGRHKRAADQFRAVLARHPNREHAVVRLASLATTAGAYEAAAGYWEQAVSINPWLPGYSVGLATSYAQSGRWASAANVIDKALDRFPLRPDLRRLRVQLDLREGNRTAAEAGLRTLVRLQPDQREQLEGWFKQLDAQPGQR